MKKAELNIFLSPGSLRINHMPYGKYQVERFSLVEVSTRKIRLSWFKSSTEKTLDFQWARLTMRNEIFNENTHDGYSVIPHLARFDTEKEALDFIKWVRSNKEKIV